MWTKEILKEIVPKCSNYSELFFKIGMTRSGASYNVIRRAMKRFGISYSHFSILRPGGTKTVSINDLTTNSRIDQGSLKKLIRSEGLLEYSCKECGNRGIHQGKELKLQLDHENGIKNDNRLSNLRWLCPNCHTQTPTYSRAKTKPSSDGLKKPVAYVILSCSECSGPFSRRKSRVLSAEKAGVKDYFCTKSCKLKFWKRKQKKSRVSQLGEGAAFT